MGDPGDRRPSLESHFSDNRSGRLHDTRSTYLPLPFLPFTLTHQQRMDPPSAMTAPKVKPSGLEVDFDHNITALYKAITSMRWNDAIRAVEKNTDEAKTWVVRHYDEHDSNGREREIMWRFLPIHSACARQPPASVISALLKAYPDGAKCVDDQGMYALHYACGNQASREVIRILLMAFPDVAKLRDPRGMLPIHYLACWGPSSISVVDMVLVANRDVANAKDEDGNTPMDLAMEGEYAERDAVVGALKRWMNNSSTTGASFGTTSIAPSTNSRKSAMKVIVPTDEKKEDYSNPPTPTGMASPHTVGKLRQQIDSLQVKQKSVDETWESRMSSQQQSHKNELADMARKIRMLETEVADGNQHMAQLENTVCCKELELKQAYDALQTKDRLLEHAYDERDGLRQTLADLTEQHDRFKRKSEILSDRLGSLNASLYTMMEQQQDVLSAMNAREEQWLALSDARREKIRELVALEETESQEETELKACLLKQTREMEAIQAVITAVRQAE